MASKVIDGDYKGKLLMYNKKTGIIITGVGFLKNAKIDENTVKSYELCDSVKTLNTLGIMKHIVGKYRVIIEFNDGKKSIIEFDDEMYRKFKLLPIKCDMPEVKIEHTSIIEPKDDIIEQIRKLSELRDSGILTEEEFENKKSELLAKI